MKKHSVCILGGTGFVGRELCARLAASKYSVLAPTRNIDTCRELRVLPTVKIVAADVHDEETLKELFAGCDIVINLIGILNEPGHRGRGFEVAHTQLATSMMKAARETGVGRVLQMSALKADAQNGPSHYLRTKGEAEQIIREQSGDIAWTIFQPSVIFGPNDSFLNRFAGLLRMAPFIPLARANARFAPVYVDDVVNAFLSALQKRETIGKTLQLCGPQVYSLRELVQFIADSIGVKRKIFNLPDVLARLQGRIFEWLPGKPFSLDNYLSLTVHSICNRNGFEFLGLQPRSMESIAPGFLKGVDKNARLSKLRQRAGR